MGDDQIKQKAISLGAADFVDKPLDPGIVRLRVNNVLSNYGIGYAYNDSLQREFLDLINRQLRGGTLCIRDMAGYPIHYVSESLARHLGYRTAAELIACVNGKWSNLICLDEVDEAEKTMRRQLYHKKEFIREYRLRKKDGEYIWIRENGKYSHDESNGKKLVALCVDITDTKNAEEKARYNEQLANVALETTGISIWEYDFKNRCIIQGENSVKVHGLNTVVKDVPRSLIERTPLPKCTKTWTTVPRRRRVSSKYGGPTSRATGMSISGIPIPLTRKAGPTAPSAYPTM